MFCLSHIERSETNNVNTTILHFTFKTILAFFKFMKVNLECTLKHVRLANSNDAIFKTDLASLKCNASWFNQLTCTVVPDVLPLGLTWGGGGGGGIAGIDWCIMLHNAVYLLLLSCIYLHNHRYYCYHLLAIHSPKFNCPSINLGIILGLT